MHDSLNYGIAKEIASLVGLREPVHAEIGVERCWAVVTIDLYEICKCGIVVRDGQLTAVTGVAYEDGKLKVYNYRWHSPESISLDDPGSLTKRSLVIATARSMLWSCDDGSPSGSHRSKHFSMDWGGRRVTAYEPVGNGIDDLVIDLWRDDQSRWEKVMRMRRTI